MTSGITHLWQTGTFAASFSPSVILEARLAERLPFDFLFLAHVLVSWPRTFVVVELPAESMG